MGVNQLKEMFLWISNFLSTLYLLWKSYLYCINPAKEALLIRGFYGKYYRLYLSLFQFFPTFQEFQKQHKKPYDESEIIVLFALFQFIVLALFLIFGRRTFIKLLVLIVIIINAPLHFDVVALFNTLKTVGEQGFEVLLPFAEGVLTYLTVAGSLLINISSGSQRTRAPSLALHGNIEDQFDERKKAAAAKREKEREIEEARKAKAQAKAAREKEKIQAESSKTKEKGSKVKEAPKQEGKKSKKD
eukprot:TRINITY_DN999_c0_g1_i1.p1 TRINITY_DN999_c0_g1~~TRINITY_DN999_c0_g1_i1.p1  ORF type:complete len:245 (+),score=74.04 TRINITY_DN999_c0_g1_i1:98-832(+)